MNTSPAQPIFLNRSAEIEHVKSLIFSLTSITSLDKPIIYYYGAPLIGKSVLLRHIQDNLQNWNIPTALIDFDYTENDINKVVFELWKQTYQAVGLGIDAIHVPNEKDDVDFITNKLTHYILNLPPKTRILWLLDTIEKINQHVWDYLQNKIFSPLIEQRRLAIVMAGRPSIESLSEAQLLNFEWFFIKKINSQRLSAFDKEFTIKHFEQLAQGASIPRNSKEWFTLTGGVPGLNCAFFKENNIQKIVSHKLLMQLPEIELSNYVINKEESRKLVLALSIFRHFDADIASKVFRKVGLSTIENKQMSWTEYKIGRKIIDTLIKTQIIEIHEDGYGYRVVQELRPSLKATYATEYPNDATLLYESSVQWYEQRVFNGDYSAVIDLIYHLLNMNKESQHLFILNKVSQGFSQQKESFKSQDIWYDKFLHVLNTEKQDWENISSDKLVWELKQSCYKMREAVLKDA